MKYIMKANERMAIKNMLPSIVTLSLNKRHSMLCDDIKNEKKQKINVEEYRSSSYRW